MSDATRRPPRASEGAGPGPDSPAVERGPSEAVPAQGTPSDRCGARRKQGGEPCRQPKGFRTDHPGSGRCWLHGGRTENGRTYAAREAATTALRRLGIPVKTDPQRALLEQVWEAAGNVAFLRARVQRLGQKSIYGPDHAGDGRPHVLVVMYNEERERLAKISKLAIDAHISAEYVEIERRQATAIAQAINAVLAVLPISDELREVGRAEAVTQLRVLGGGKEASAA